MYLVGALCRGVSNPQGLHCCVSICAQAIAHQGVDRLIIAAVAFSHQHLPTPTALIDFSASFLGKIAYAILVLRFIPPTSLVAQATCASACVLYLVITSLLKCQHEIATAGTDDRLHTSSGSRLTEVNHSKFAITECLCHPHKEHTPAAAKQDSICTARAGIQSHRIASVYGGVSICGASALCLCGYLGLLGSTS